MLWPYWMLMRVVLDHREVHYTYIRQLLQKQEETFAYHIKLEQADMLKYLTRFNIIPTEGLKKYLSPFSTPSVFIVNASKLISWQLH